MIAYRLAIALSTVLTINTTVELAQDSASAKEFVQHVYADYANPDTNHQQQRQRHFYTPQLYRLILTDRTSHRGEVGKLDSDPICDCQDPGDPGELKVKSINLSSAGQSRIRATVAIVIVKTPVTVVLSLYKTPAGWLIDDISTSDMPSLRSLLRGPE
jgi:hypothetical protein